MPLSDQLRSLFDYKGRQCPPTFALMLAANQKDVRAAQRQRHRVFAEERGARLSSPTSKPIASIRAEPSPTVQHVFCRTDSR